MHSALRIPEILERILLHLDHIPSMIQSQRVCHTWKSLIQTSPSLQEACWYRPLQGQTNPVNENDPVGTWELNPIFNLLGVTVSKYPDTVDRAYIINEEGGTFSLRERIYDYPGSWTTMFATHPPCRRFQITFHGDYSQDGNMNYSVESTTGPDLLMGDIMAVLAEAQHRHERGLDRWAGVVHFIGSLKPITEQGCREMEWHVPKLMAKEGVSINVAVEMGFSGEECTAFSLRRVYPSLTGHSAAFGSGGGKFLHEMIVHKMICGQGRGPESDSPGYEYRWGHWRGRPGTYKKGASGGREYKANLVVVKEYQGDYLTEWKHIYRLLSDVQT